MNPGYWWQPMFGFSWVFPILCIIFMLAMMFLMFRGRRGCMSMCRGAGKHRQEAHPTPRQVLDRRLAGGEITKQEHEDLKRRIDAP